jgi:hypothetical protein
MNDLEDSVSQAGGHKDTHNNKNNVIITKKEINYIDTLYLSCNLEDFFYPSLVSGLDKIDLTDVELDKSHKYRWFYNYVVVPMLKKAEYLGIADGREWYSFDLYRVGIMDYEKAKRANQHNCVIQYEHSHIFELGLSLDDLELPFGSDFSKYKVKRIDITKTASLDNDYTFGYGYISSFKQHPFKYNRVEDTIYLGKRSNGCVFRIYNKTKELQQNKDYAKLSKFEDIFNGIEGLYTFELELRRSYLKESLGIDNLSQFDDILKASQNIISKIKFIKDNERNRKLVEQNNRDRIAYEVLTEFVSFERPKKKKYARSRNAMLKRIKSEIDAYLCAYPDDDTNSFYVSLIADLMPDVLKGKDIEIYIEDSERKKEYDAMLDKFEKQRVNQSNSNLEFEAWYEFEGKFNNKHKQSKSMI